MDVEKGFQLVLALLQGIVNRETRVGLGAAALLRISLPQQQGLTLIPLHTYFSKRGLAKVELGLAKGKKQHDHRELIKTREASREVKRAMKDKR